MTEFGMASSELGSKKPGLSSATILPFPVFSSPQLTGMSGEACAEGGEPEALVGFPGCIEPALQCKKDGRAAHVAVVAEHLAGFCEGKG